MRLARFIAVTALFVTPVAFAAENHQHSVPSASSSDASKEKCEHGVQKSLCARCNPKLAAVYKAKGDWCADHERPESQCVLCHPELARKGLK